MMRQPKDFVAVNAEITNPGKPNKFRNYDAVGRVKNTWESYMDTPKNNSGKKKLTVPGKSPSVKKTFSGKKKNEGLIKAKASDLVERLLAPPTAPARS